MYVQVFRRAAILAPPPISFEHPLAKQIVVFDAELQSRTFLAKALHCFYLNPILSNGCSRKKISADHLQAITPRLIASEHQANSFEGLLDHR
jgi:hypothetical protein